MRLNESDPVLTCNERFQRTVNTSISAIQVPTNVYDGGEWIFIPVMTEPIMYYNITGL